jgi:hypothetical protein
LIAGKLSTSPDDDSRLKGDSTSRLRQSKGRGKAMVKTYRDVAIEQMIATVEAAMSQVIDWWGDLPTDMKDAIKQFRTQLGSAIDSVEFVKRALDREVHETDRGKGSG